MKQSQLLCYSFRLQFLSGTEILLSSIKDLYQTDGCGVNEKKLLKALFRLLKKESEFNEKQINNTFRDCDENDLDNNDEEPDESNDEQQDQDVSDDEPVIDNNVVKFKTGTVTYEEPDEEPINDDPVNSAPDVPPHARETLDRISHQFEKQFKQSVRDKPKKVKKSRNGGRR